MDSEGCRVVSVGKRRDGSSRFWCLTHRADATEKYGMEAARCRRADIAPVQQEERLVLDPKEFAGGVGIWGSVPPVYDTTSTSLEAGIHVHARKANEKEKFIDKSFREVIVKGMTRGDVTISEAQAIYFLVSTLLGFRTKVIRCTRCGSMHLDEDWFSVHAHKRHLCEACGRTFHDEEAAVGNPLAAFVDDTGRRVRRARKTLDVAQADYRGGIQIWGSNPSILWTGRRPEEEGIHIHAFDGRGKQMVDDTFSTVTIDGCSLDPEMVRTYMAQQTLPHLSGRLACVTCTSCGHHHMDEGELRVTPHSPHVCERCGESFVDGTPRLRATISNPVVGVLRQLSQNAVQKPRVHSLGLFRVSM
jgi:transposase-like protein